MSWISITGSETMDCWSVLQIPATADHKEVKRAYARLLKTTKPDEDPAGFQRLHAAYKLALRQAAAMTGAAAGQAIPEITDVPVMPGGQTPTRAEPIRTEGGEDGPDEWPATESARTEEDLPEEIRDTGGEALADPLWFDTQWNVLLERVDRLLADGANRNRAAAWDFLGENEALLQIQFKSAFARALLEKLIEHQAKSEAISEIALDPRIIQRLDTMFWWSGKRHAYEDQFSDRELRRFFSAVDQGTRKRGDGSSRWTSTGRAMHRGPIVFGQSRQRIFAFAVDLALAGLIIGMASALFDLFPAQERQLLGTLTGLLLLAVPAMESSRLQGTPGKLLLGLKVMSQKGRRLNFFHALWRTLVFGAAMGFLMYTVFIYLVLNEGRLLHDRLSFSIVAQRNEDW